MATHCNILAWETPWTGQSGGVHSEGSQESDVTEHTQRPCGPLRLTSVVTESCVESLLMPGASENPGEVRAGTSGNTFTANVYYVKNIYIWGAYFHSELLARLWGWRNFSPTFHISLATIYYLLEESGTYAWPAWCRMSPNPFPRPSSHPSYTVTTTGEVSSQGDKKFAQVMGPQVAEPDVKPGRTQPLCQAAVRAPGRSCAAKLSSRLTPWALVWGV